jgi:uncharacterized repeat protein (TIGR01451 family)
MKSRIRKKRRLGAAAGLLFGAGICGMALADTVDGPPADGESVLIIYTSASTTGFSTDLRNAFKDALLSITPAPTITEVEVKTGDGTGPGFYDELVAQTGQKDLSNWCQVYDLRFRDDRNNIGWTGQNQEDVLTYVGTNTDWELFENYLNAGGSLFLQGEHHDYYIRDANLIMFINDVALQPITQMYANIHIDQGQINTFSADPDNFNTDFNNLNGGYLTGNYAGGIDTANAGSGRPITTLDIGAMALAWLPQDLKTVMGRMVVSFESNAFAESELQNATSKAWIQNVYDLLSGCYRYDFQKSFVPDTLKLHQEGTFKLAYKNNGAHDMQNFVVSDTIPSCLEFISSTPAPTGNTGNYYWWNISSVPKGGSGIITVNYRSISMPPCK